MASKSRCGDKDVAQACREPASCPHGSRKASACLITLQISKRHQRWGRDGDALWLAAPGATVQGCTTTPRGVRNVLFMKKQTCIVVGALCCLLIVVGSAYCCSVVSVGSNNNKPPLTLQCSTPHTADSHRTHTNQAYHWC